MKRLILASLLLARLTLGCEADAASAKSKPAPVYNKALELAINADLKAIGRWSGGYGAVLRDEYRAVDEVAVGANHAVDLARAGDRDAAARWAATWAAERRARFAEINAAAQKLRSEPLPATTAKSARIYNRMADVAEVPGRIADSLADDAKLVDPLIDEIGALAAGDPEAMARLGSIRVKLLIAEENNDAAFQKLAGLTQRSDSAEAALIDSVLQTDETSIAILRSSIQLPADLEQHRPLPDVVWAQSLMVGIDVSMVNSSAQLYRALAKRAPADKSAKLNRVADAFERSAAVEENVAKEMTRIREQVINPPQTPEAAIRMVLPLLDFAKEREAAHRLRAEAYAS